MYTYNFRFFFILAKSRVLKFILTVKHKRDNVKFICFLIANGFLLAEKLIKNLIINKPNSKVISSIGIKKKKGNHYRYLTHIVVTDNISFNPMEIVMNVIIIRNGRTPERYI